MDPRPYHFEYRKPRPNPTFQSSHLYGSIYLIEKSLISPEINEKSCNRYFKSQSINPAGITRYRSDLQISHKNEIKPIQQSGTSKVVLPKLNSENIQHISKKEQFSDQKSIYERQQKNYNIISYYPNRYRNRIKQHPKLTMEDKIYELSSFKN